MKKGMYVLILSIFISLVTGCANSVSKEETIAIKAKKKEGWKLTFSDNFEGEKLDPKKWAHAPEWTRHSGQWSDQEAFLDGNGHLIIQVSEKDGKYYSGAIRTKDIFEQAYGYYEIHAKLPKEEGFWTAFWLMSNSVHTVGNDGKDGTEIDIFETPFAKKGDYIQHALHWDGYEQNHKSAGEVAHIPGIYEGYHTFALEWNKDEYIFYIDDQETWRTSAGGVSQSPSYLKITAEVGDWAGNIKNANLPAQLEVDYVRVYERKKD
ncbi:family 16 glycosylhydrolase [Lederbergia wuyishanensis]